MHSSNRMKLKICGMRDAENIRNVAALHPDYMGFIFYPNSKRAVSEKFVIPNDFPGDIKRVGVFVNEKTLVMLNLARKYSLDFLQLHGEETVEQCEELRKNGARIIKAFSIQDDFDFDSVVRYKKSADYFLFDTKGPGYGGTGSAFDWTILERYDQEIPFFLSGGLSSHNVLEVVKLKGMNIHGLDVNSGVEVEPGMKDIGLIKTLHNKMLNKHWLEY